MQLHIPPVPPQTPVPGMHRLLLQYAFPMERAGACCQLKQLSAGGGTRSVRLPASDHLLRVSTRSVIASSASRHSSACAVAAGGMASTCKCSTLLLRPPRHASAQNLG